jgi:S-adenosylmethionine-diacylglycerol 3-amino-3-carboxypropyl transferase
MLSKGPQHLVAVDISPAQLACLELRVAAYRELTHSELLELIGSRKSVRRAELYARCRRQLTTQARQFWDGHAAEIAAGIGAAGKFERYLKLFSVRILPLVHSWRTRQALLAPRSAEERAAFYAAQWNNWRWRAIFRLFFSRWLMGRLGRSPKFFRHVEGDVAGRIFERTRYALTELDPAQNPYLQWILLGQHGSVLPYALRAQNFDAIRSNLDRLEWRCQSVEEFAQACAPNSIDGFNLSDIFEYMSPERYAALLRKLADCGRPGGRMVYWNMLASRRRPSVLAERLHPLRELSTTLFRQDKAFFYGDFVVEEIMS